jgi:hypothetical protein
MYYQFKSRQKHSFLSIVKRRLYELLWPAAFILLVQYLFPENKLVENNFHLYSLLIIEFFKIGSILTEDSIEEIIINTSLKNIELSYYNIYEGHVQKKLLFSEIKVLIECNSKEETTLITLIVKKKDSFSITKNKDQFSQEDLHALKELLYSITSPEIQ